MKKEGVNGKLGVKKAPVLIVLLGFVVVLMLAVVYAEAACNKYTLRFPSGAFHHEQLGQCSWVKTKSMCNQFYQGGILVIKHPEYNNDPRYDEVYTAPPYNCHWGCDNKDVEFNGDCCYAETSDTCIAPAETNLPRCQGLEARKQGVDLIYFYFSKDEKRAGDVKYEDFFDNGVYKDWLALFIRSAEFSNNNIEEMSSRQLTPWGNGVAEAWQCDDKTFGRPLEECDACAEIDTKCSDFSNVECPNKNMNFLEDKNIKVCSNTGQYLLNIEDKRECLIGGGQIGDLRCACSIDSSSQCAISKRYCCYTSNIGIYGGAEQPYAEPYKEALKHLGSEVAGGVERWAGMSTKEHLIIIGTGVAIGGLAVLSGGTTVIAPVATGILVGGGVISLMLMPIEPILDYIEALGNPYTPKAEETFKEGVKNTLVTAECAAAACAGAELTQVVQNALKPCQTAKKLAEATAPKTTKYVTVYHGSRGPQVQTDNLMMNGPSHGRKFFLTPDRSLAERAAGPSGKVLTYKIPESEASKILGKEKEYLGVIGDSESTQYIIMDDVTKRLLHQYLVGKPRAY